MLFLDPQSSYLVPSYSSKLVADTHRAWFHFSTGNLVGIIGNNMLNSLPIIVFHCSSHIWTITASCSSSWNSCRKQGGYRRSWGERINGPFGLRACTSCVTWSRLPFVALQILETSTSSKPTSLLIDPNG